MSASTNNISIITEYARGQPRSLHTSQEPNLEDPQLNPLVIIKPIQPSKTKDNLSTQTFKLYPNTYLV